MKKLLKVTLSTLCVLLMTGCGSKSEDDTSKKEDTKTVEKEEKISKSKYFDNFEEDYELRLSDYSINIPEDSYTNYSGNCDIFEFDAKNNSKIKALISSVSAFGDEAADMKLEKISEYFKTSKDYAYYAFIGDPSPVFTIQKENDNKINKYNVKLSYGNGNVTAKEKDYNFIKVDFWLKSTNNDKDFGKVKDLCEVLICSDDYEEKDLKNIAEELISQIHETK